MTTAPAIRTLFDPPDEIIQAGLDGELVFFVGAGASKLLGLPTWGELAEKTLTELRDQGFLNYAELKQLKKLADPKKQLTIADLITRGKKYDLNLNIKKHLEDFSEGDSIYKAINDIAPPCVTTNYDELLTPRFYETKDVSVTAAPVVRKSSPEDFLAKYLDEPGSVIHLHGSISKPDTMIVTARDYFYHYENENVQHFLGTLFERKTVLFIGYRLEEVEVLEHILRHGKAKTSKERKRFALIPFFKDEKTVYEHLHAYYRDTFGVHLLGFARDEEDYKQLELLLKTWVPLIKIKKPPLAADVEYMNKVLGNE